MKRKLPTTSHEANSFMTHQMREDHRLKIIKALSILENATGEEIANLSGLKYAAVMRRMKEMQPNLVYKNGETRKNTSGVNAMVYRLTEAGYAKVKTNADAAA